MCRNAVCIARSAPTWLRTALLSHVQPVKDGYSGSLGLAKQPRSGEKHAENMVKLVFASVAAGDTNSRLRPSWSDQ